MSERNFEQNGNVQKIKFDALGMGDVVILQTASGSSYRLSVEDNQDKLLVTVERSSDHEVKEDETTRWERVQPETVFDLRGSCRRMIQLSSSALMAVDSTEGRFVVGERAWLGCKLDGEDRTLITSDVISIDLIPTA